MTKNYQSLLRAVEREREFHDKTASITGANYNVFSLLQLDRKEDKLHSPFIADLLHPQGSHQQGTVFLKAFINMLTQKFKGLSKLSNLKAERTRVNTEEFIGKVRVNEGGRIDIYITDGLHTIAIENKIDADDQENQLLRYANHLKGKENAALLYLSLKGRAPSERSTNKKLVEGTDYYRLSYQKDILAWLEDCKRIAVDLPILRECLKQYINTIKELCGMSLNEDKKKEIEKLIKHHFGAALDIATHFEAVRLQIINDFRIDLIDYLTENLDSAIYRVEPCFDIDAKYSKIVIMRHEEKHPYKLHFNIESFSADGHWGGDLYVSLLANYGTGGLLKREGKILLGEGLKGWHPKKENLNVNTKEEATLKQLSQEKSRKQLVEQLGLQCVQFIQEHEDLLKNLYRKF